MNLNIYGRLSSIVLYIGMRVFCLRGGYLPKTLIRLMLNISLTSLKSDFLTAVFTVQIHSVYGDRYLQGCRSPGGVPQCNEAILQL